MTCQLQIQDLGRIEYELALEKQREVQRKVIEQRNSDSETPFHLLLLEHDPPVITVSNRPSAKANLVATEQQLLDSNIQVCKTDRGGDITYHGPGQLVGYSICDLNKLSLRVHGYMRFLEGCVMDVLHHFGIEGRRDECATGVWVDGEKICAMGVRVSRWVSMHGFALNVTPNLQHFDLIVPCGLVGRRVTSMEKILGKQCPSMPQVKTVVMRTFETAIAHQVQVQQEPHQ